MIMSKANRFISGTAAALMLAVMLVLMFFSSVGDSATMDELAHIPAGFSYLTQKDYRLNPEHPPLMKDLAALPLLFLNLNFPTNVKAWAQDINGQWDMGRIFLYESGNDPDRILFWARLPMMLLAVILGWLIFSSARKLYGDRVGLLTLFFFSFSPTFIAHSRYVTTDLAAAFGFFIGIASFIYYLKFPGLGRVFYAGAALGIALLLKFSLVLLLPIFAVLVILWGFLSQLDYLRESEKTSKRLKKLFYEWGRLTLGFLVIFLIAVFIIAVFYQYHVWNYPLERQISDSTIILSSFGFRPAVDFTLFLVENPMLRGFGQYMLGLLMVIQRAAGGNTTYFLGEVSSSGWWYYFPVAYLLKEPLAFLLLAFVALLVALKSLLQAHERSFLVSLEWMRDNFFLTASFLFIAVYWLQSIKGPLNIGVRHVLPTFPFIYLLVSREIVRWLKFYSLSEPQNFGEWLTSIYERFIKALPRYLLMGILLLWLGLGAVFAFPNYLSYYNIFAGGSANGYKYIVDSNYDWGQDLRRLNSFVQANGVASIAVDYFGGGSPSYYIGDKFVPWWSAKGKPDPSKGDPKWFAISATFRQSSFGRPVRGFEIKPEDSYSWLRDFEPTARAGHSIFIYKL